MKAKLFILMGLLTFVITACAGNPTPTPPPSPEPATAVPEPTQAPAPTEAPAATAAPAPTEAPAPAVQFDGTDAEEEGYWYSRYNLGNLVMRSGLGEPFMPEMEMVQGMIQMVDADPNDGDTAVPAQNVTLLKAVYASGDPHYTQQLDVADFGTQSWDPASFDATVTSRAMGWTMLKESEWAKQFHVDDHFGTPADDFGAQWRFVGMIMNASASMQGQYALQMLKNEQGLIANSDGEIDWAGQWVMLEAFSDLGGLKNVEALPHSASNRYHDPNAAAMFLGAADSLFNALASRQPADTEELSLAVQSLTWYAANTTSAVNQSLALEMLAQFGNKLTNAAPDTAVSQAQTIRGLIEAYRVLGDDTYLTAAAANFDALSGSFDAESGVFASQSSYTIDDVGAIMGALNSLKIFAGDAVDQTAVEAIFTRFFESAVNQSGLQQAVPPVNVAKGAFEQEEPANYYGYPGIPMPPMAGGDFGVAPVFAGEVTWDGGQWLVSDGRFYAAGAMHASNEFIWFHNDEVDGFPVITPLAQSGTGVQGGVAEFDPTAAEEEGYWYSRYNLLALTLQSGNGEVFMPAPDMMMAAMQMVDADPNDGDAVVPPTNPAMLSIIYAGGDPHFTQMMDPADFATMRWVGGDTSVTTEASAWAIVKELEWAKQFHVDDHFGTPDADFGAQQRFVGMVMSLSAKKQAMTWMQSPDSFENSLTGSYAMLIALSDGAGMYAADALPHSETNRYADADAAAMFAQAADMLFAQVAASQPESARELSIGIQSLVWYAANTANADNRAAALDTIAQWADALAAAPTSTPTEHAYAVRGLIESGRTGDSAYLDAAAAHFTALAAGYDGTHGLFAGQTTYSVEDAGVILGSINAARLFLGDRINQSQAAAIFGGFYEGTVNLSGMQTSAPPVELFKAPFEQEEPEIYLRYPGAPMPPMAGGEFGMAPVLAASVTWDGSQWTADTSNFDTAGTMHTINEMIWFHNDEVNGFPEIGN